MEFSSAPKTKKQNLYYRLTVYDNEAGRGKIAEDKVPAPVKPLYDEQQAQMADEILLEAENLRALGRKKLLPF